VKIVWEEDRSKPISVVIPTRDRADMVFALLSSLRRHTAIWDLLEIVVLVNGAPSTPTSYAFSEIENVFDRARIVFREMPFNWAAINNVAVNECAENSLLVFLNDDMLCLTQDWDLRLRSQLARPEIGVVGGRLLYPNGTLQHGGVIFCHNAWPVHEAVGDAPSDGLYLDRTLLVHETATVTGAFLACRRTVFNRLGGFDAQRYAVIFSDTDFCVRAPLGASIRDFPSSRSRSHRCVVSGPATSARPMESSPAAGPLTGRRAHRKRCKLKRALPHAAAGSSGVMIWALGGRAPEGLLRPHGIRQGFVALRSNQTASVLGHRHRALVPPARKFLEKAAVSLRIWEPYSTEASSSLPSCHSFHDVISTQSGSALTASCQSAW
jgi:hypothetical protein